VLVAVPDSEKVLAGTTGAQPGDASIHLELGVGVPRWSGIARSKSNGSRSTEPRKHMEKEFCMSRTGLTRKKVFCNFKPSVGVLSEFKSEKVPCSMTSDFWRWKTGGRKRQLTDEGLEDHSTKVCLAAESLHACTGNIEEAIER
jgi:hypothetical protein